MLIIVRHGQTDSNARGLLLGRKDPGLDDVGRGQAAALADVLTVDRVVTSPLLRARQTAEVFGLPVTVDERWIEIDYGVLDGMPLADVPASLWMEWRADECFRPEGGESLVELSERVDAACADLRDEARERDVAVVTHVSPVKAAAGWALGMGCEIAWRTFVAPASITRVGFTDRGAVLRSFNETTHLATGQAEG